MAYIYKITNEVNKRVYIGKTIRSLEVRWREHKKDFFSGRKQDLPLYAAMKKYGIDKFNIELIEECSDEVVSERERFWIQEFQSFKNGYNATIGGDGKPYIDYDLVCSLYEQLQNQTEVANHMNINRTTVAYILKSRHIPTKSSGEMAKEKSSKPVVCYAKTGELINSFSSMADAARYIKEIKNSTANLSSIITNIGRCVSGKRKTAYDFIWK